MIGQLQSVPVYFARREADGAIKIGASANPKRRMVELPGAHTLIGTIEGGGHSLELIICDTFAEYRLYTERPTPAVQSWTEYFVFPRTVDAAFVDELSVVFSPLIARWDADLERVNAA